MVEDTARRRAWIPVLDLRLEVMRSRSIPPERLSEAVELVLSRPFGLAEILTSGFVAAGFPTAQIQLNLRSLRHAEQPSRRRCGRKRRGLGSAWRVGSCDDSPADRWASASADGDGASARIDWEWPAY